MLHLLCSVGTIAFTNTTHSWSAPPPDSASLVARSWDHHETQRPLKGWLSIISSEGGGKYNSYLHSSRRKRPLEQEMTVDVLIFKRWAPRSLGLRGRSCSNVTELPSYSSSRLTLLRKGSERFCHVFPHRHVFDNKHQILARSLGHADGALCLFCLLYYSLHGIHELVCMERLRLWDRRSLGETGRRHCLPRPRRQETSLLGDTINTLPPPRHLSSTAACILPTGLTGNLQGGEMTWQTIMF